MTYFVLVIYTAAPTGESSSLRSCMNALQRMGLETVLTDDDGCNHTLPMPVLAGEFCAQDVRQCREYVYSRVQMIFNEYSVQGKFFVLVSERYTWTTEEIRMSAFGMQQSVRAYGLR